MISSIFVCHGGPTLAIDKNEYSNFLKELGKGIKPKAIVIFTAHWENETTTISSVNGSYDMIYDFYGFPKELYSIKYPAKGSPELAARLQGIFEKQGIKANLDTKRGLDHGSWVMLHLMYPEAVIPVVQVSVNPYLSMEKQYEIGKAIRALGEEDILVMGSGSTVHNLRAINWGAEEVEKWASDFDDWLIDKVEKKDLQHLFKYSELAPNAKKAVPREEHLVPLFIAMGSGQEGIQSKTLHRSYEFGSLSYICFEF
jgi:4,5-DOPA dioxygenase extradiol